MLLGTFKNALSRGVTSFQGLEFIATFERKHIMYISLDMERGTHNYSGKKSACYVSNAWSVAQINQQSLYPFDFKAVRQVACKPAYMKPTSLKLNPIEALPLQAVQSAAYATHTHIAAVN